MIRFWARRFGVQIFALAVSADHVHIHLQAPSRSTYVRWVRATTSRLVAGVRGLKFTLRPYSRVVSWGRDVRRMGSYLRKNLFEAKLVLSAWSLARTIRERGREAALVKRSQHFVAN